jgi:acyl-CoA synthetase (AMP-forming)/AMP-acid ligase II
VKRDAKGRCVRNEEPGRTGLLVGRISFLATFDGYVDSKATESKILKDVFRKGDAWFNTGDLVTVHEDGWVSFADRVGDTFRWKGENVSTSEVALILNAAPGVLESNVYGVVVPDQDGRAGMASLRVADGFDLDAFARHVTSKLPRYARPLFIRMEDGIRVTSTFKHQKQDYQREGFDPNVVRVPLYVLQGERYETLDAAAYDELCKGQRTPG